MGNELGSQWGFPGEYFTSLAFARSLHASQIVDIQRIESEVEYMCRCNEENTALLATCWLLGTLISMLGISGGYLPKSSSTSCSPAVAAVVKQVSAQQVSCFISSCIHYKSWSWYLLPRSNLWWPDFLFWKSVWAFDIRIPNPPAHLSVCHVTLGGITLQLCNITALVLGKRTHLYKPCSWWFSRCVRWLPGCLTPLLAVACLDG